MGADSFSYDPVSRLVAATLVDGQAAETNSYDAFGNRTSATTTSVGSRSLNVDPSTNRLLTKESLIVEHDDRGNVTDWGPNKVGEVTAKAKYDPFDMIERYREQTSPGSFDVDLSYVYTADDERTASFTSEPTISERWTLRDLDGKLLRSFTRSPTQGATWQKDTIHRQGQVNGAGRELSIGDVKGVRFTVAKVRSVTLNSTGTVIKESVKVFLIPKPITFEVCRSTLRRTKSSDDSNPLTLARASRCRV